ncbi:MAG: hypothetical protein U9Q24_03180 [Candidatus Ratteibacteria bacterium]|nr:hypothetical protein [Candidatus Ratteibacteria bacterium]
MGNKLVLVKSRFIADLFSIFCVSLSGTCLGIFFWIQGLDFFHFRLADNRLSGLWIIPEGVGLSKYILGGILAYLSFWLFYSFILSVVKKGNFRFILRQDVSSYLPSLFLLTTLIQFLPRPAGLRNFGIFLGQYAGGILVLAAIAGIILLKYRALKFISKRDVLSLKPTKFLARLTQRQIKRIIFIFSFAVYAIFTFHNFHFDSQSDYKYYLLSGDEPQYLLITHSLVFDRDFNLFNNQRQKDWKYFEKRPVTGHAPGFEYYNRFARGRLKPREKFWENRSYSVHRLGLPLMLGPAYLAGFKRGMNIRLAVMLFLNLCVALAAVNIYSLSFELSGNKLIALAVWLSLSFAAPILFYSNKIFPDTAAGLLIIFAYRKIRNFSPGRFLKPLLIGLCIAYLPWLHERFIFTSVILFLFFIFSAKFSLKPILISIMPIALSLVLQAGYYHLLFGIPYPVNVHPFFSLKYGLQHGMPGLLLDQNQGLWLYSPVYLLALIGMAGYLKERPGELFWLSLIVVPNYLMIGFFRDWTGGLAPPTRYLMPLAPLLAVPIAYSLSRVKDVGFKFSALVLSAIGILTAFYGMRYPGLLYRYIHPLIPAFNKYLNLKILFPNFLTIDNSSYPLCLFWLLIIFGFCFYYAYRGFWKQVAITKRGSA